MRDPNDGSDPSAHGAPWNEDDDGECDCSRCRRERHRQEREEAQIDEYEYKNEKPLQDFTLGRSGYVENTRASAL